MKLNERVRQRSSMGLAHPDLRPHPAAAPAAAPAAPSAPPDDHRRADPFGPLKERVQQALLQRLGARLFDADLSEEQLRTYVQQEIGQLVEGEAAPLTADERRRLVREISDDAIGLGPVERHLADDDVSEIMVNGTAPIYVERAGRLHRTTSRFMSDEHLRRVIERIVAQVGRRIDESSPMVDARLPDGSRVNAVIPPLAVDGPVLTIRKFSKDPLQVSDLVAKGSLTPEVASVLAACVEGKLNVLVAGGTGTGKTTMLNILSSFIPSTERIVTIEDSVELQLRQDHVVRLEARPPNVEGRGEVSIRDLVRNALRMRPDRIIIGEVRGGEAMDMLQAMNTGHEGSLGTVHANTPRDALSRLETMVLMAGIELPQRAIREQVASAIDLIIHISRLRDGSRRVTHVSEVTGMEGDIITLQDVFSFHHAGMTEDGRVAGSIVPTGLRPRFMERLADAGITLPQEVFGTVDVLDDLRGRR